MTELVPSCHRLPWEVLLAILPFADDPTLAALSRVSFDLLHSTTPLLYLQEVEVRSIKGLTLLFLEREESSEFSSRIIPYLDLSQIRTLHLNFASLVDSPLSIHLSSSRLSIPGPSPLTTLRITLSYLKIGTLALLNTSLFPLVNPTRFQQFIVERPETNLPMAGFRPDSRPLIWDRLEVLEMSGVVSLWRTEPGLWMLEEADPPTVSPRRRTLRIHLHTLFSHPVPESLKFIWRREPDQFVVGFDRMGKRSVVLVVRSEQERVETTLIVEQLEEEKRSLFVIELEA